MDQPVMESPEQVLEEAPMEFSEQVEAQIPSPENPEIMVSNQKQATLPFDELEEVKETPLRKSVQIDQMSGLNLIVDPDETEQDRKKIEANLESQPSLPPQPDPPFLPAKPQDDKLTLVLDLDETLIHYNEEEDFFLMRPGCHQFIECLSELYELVVFTASMQEYADWVVASGGGWLA